MKCEEVSMLLADSRQRQESAERRTIDEHLAVCDDCRHAMHALDVLQAEQYAPIPKPRAVAFGRAMRAVADAHFEPRTAKGGFWTGLAVGAAAAAVIVAVLLALVMPGSPSGGLIPPEVTLALNESRDVSIAIDSPEPLRDAEIRVMLRGAIDLDGFEGQRDIRWTTSLERGVNELSLPVIAVGPQGGRLVVEVHHGEKRKTFLVDVHTARPKDIA